MRADEKTLRAHTGTLLKNNVPASTQTLTLAFYALT